MVEDKISNNIYLSSPVKIVWPFLTLAFSWKYKITKSKCWYMYLIIIIHNQTVNKFVQKCPLHWVSSSVLFCPNIRKGFVVYFGWFYAVMYLSKTLHSQWHWYREQIVLQDKFIDILEYHSMHHYLVLWNCDILFWENCIALIEQNNAGIIHLFIYCG